MYIVSIFSFYVYMLNETFGANIGTTHELRTAPSLCYFSSSNQLRVTPGELRVSTTRSWLHVTFCFCRWSDVMAALLCPSSSSWAMTPSRTSCGCIHPSGCVLLLVVRLFSILLLVYPVGCQSSYCFTSRSILAAITITKFPVLH